MNISLERELQISNEIQFDSNEYFRVCCKIALNGLCFLEGKEYVLKNEVIENRLNKLQIPKYSHFMIFFHVEDGIHCILGIYGILHQIHLCKKREYDDFLNGLICDWQNKKEYSLEEYLLEKIKDRKFYEQYFMDD